MEEDTIPRLVIGQNYFVRDGVDYWIGRLKGVGPHCVYLEDAAWIASTGRLHIFMREGSAPNMEVEIHGDVCVQWRTWSVWKHPLFKESV